MKEEDIEKVSKELGDVMGKIFFIAFTIAEQVSRVFEEMTEAEYTKLIEQINDEEGKYNAEA